MKIQLVTGGSGFIGSNYVRQRLVRGDIDKVVNLDALTYAGNPQNLEAFSNDPRYVFAHGDIADSELIAKLLREHEVTSVVNFAAESHVDRSIDSPEPFFETNVTGTLRLLEQVKRYWSELDAKTSFRFLHVSTDEVYGSLSPSDPAFREETPYSPNSPYSASKASSDHIVRAYQHTYGLPTLTTNCSNNYGPYQFPEKLIPLMISNATADLPLPIYGDGSNIRDWLFVEDHCTAISLVLAEGKIGETYNIGGNEEKANIEVVETLCRTLDKLKPRKDGKSYLEQKTFVKDRPGHDWRYAVDTTKIKEELGWQPAHNFEQAIEKTVHWYLENGKWSQAIKDKSYQGQRLGLKD